MTLKPSGELKENCRLPICPKAKTLNGLVIQVLKRFSSSVFLELISCTHRAEDSISTYLNHHIKMKLYIKIQFLFPIPKRASMQIASNHKKQYRL